MQKMLHFKSVETVTSDCHSNQYGCKRVFCWFTATVNRSWIYIVCVFFCFSNTFRHIYCISIHICIFCLLMCFWINLAQNVKFSRYNWKNRANGDKIGGRIRINPQRWSLVILLSNCLFLFFFFFTWVHQMVSDSIHQSDGLKFFVRYDTCNGQKFQPLTSC